MTERELVLAETLTTTCESYIKLKWWDVFFNTVRCSQSRQNLYAAIINTKLYLGFYAPNHQTTIKLATMMGTAETIFWQGVIK